MAGFFDKGTFEFLADLKKHNNRDWFTKNKDRYLEEVRDPFLEFIAACGPQLKKVSSHIVADPRPVGGSLFRIYRDVRFSKDKSPYKTHAGAHFQLGGKGVHWPGYYLHLEPGGCFIAGGMWMPEAKPLRMIREAIAERPAEWKKARPLLDTTEDKLVRAPQGFDPDHPLIDDIKRKSFTASKLLSEKEVCNPNFMRTFIDGCKSTAPLMKFLSRAVGAPW